MAMIAPGDAAFLVVESREHPMHVGALQVYKLPQGAKRDYVGQLYEECLKFTELRPLLRQRPRNPVSSVGQVWWETDDDVDLEYHVRTSALPAPGRVRELLALVSRLHGSLLDRHRPLWEFHLIEGLEGRRFATYTKMHHALVDGVAAMGLLTGSLSEDPDAAGYPVWAARDEGTEPPPKPESESESSLGGRLFGSLKAAGESALGMAEGTANLTKLATDMLRGQREGVSLPAPKTLFNVPITGARRFAAQSWAIDRLKRAGAPSNATLNDVVLAMCAGALRRYLEAANDLPDRPLVAACPVSMKLRGKKSAEGGNAIGSVLCSLATDIADPRERLDAIRASMETSKETMANMSPTQFQTAGMLVMAAPQIIAAVPGAASVVPPMFNVIISNVPGPRNPLYWNGALMESIYPVSLPFDGQGMNMTVLSYAGAMHFGITGCRRSVPHLQHLLGYLEESLAELETA